MQNICQHYFTLKLFRHKLATDREEYEFEGFVVFHVQKKFDSSLQPQWHEASLTLANRQTSGS